MTTLLNRTIAMLAVMLLAKATSRLAELQALAPDAVDYAVKNPSLRLR